MAKPIQVAANDTDEADAIEMATGDAEAEAESDSKEEEKAAAGSASSTVKKKGEGDGETEGESNNAAVQNALGALAGGGTGLPFGAIIRFSNVVGYGTFLSDKNNRRPLYDIGVSLNPYFDVAAGHRISASMGITKNIFSNGDAGSSELAAVSREGQTSVSDLIISYTALNVVTEPFTGLRLNLGVGVVAPTSLQSQTSTLYLGTRAQATVLGIWDWFVAAYTFRVTKNFHEYTHNKVENSGSPPICINRDNVDTSACFPGGYANTEWSFLNSLFISFMATDALSFNINWAFINSLSYDVDRDAEFVGANADSGRGQRDLMFGSLSVNYQLSQYFAASIGATTVQLPFTADNKSFRFPFFSTNPDNTTVFDLTLTGTF